MLSTETRAFLPNSVFCSELLGQGRGHELPANVGRGREVAFPLLAARASCELVKLHLAMTAETRKAGLSFRGCSPGLNGPREEDQPGPRGAMDFDILGSGTTGRQKPVSIARDTLHLIELKINK